MVAVDRSAIDVHADDQVQLLDGFRDATRRAQSAATAGGLTTEIILQDKAQALKTVGCYHIH